MFKGVVAFIKEMAPGYDPSEPLSVRDVLQYYSWATKWELREARRDFEIVKSEAECLAPDEQVFSVT